jgi:hypothetical protein
MYYLALTKQVNENAAAMLGYSYSFIKIPEKYTREMHPAAAKIFVVNDYLQTAEDDILVFLDTDAWVQNTKYLHKVVQHLVKDPAKHGCYSRETYVRKNTYINSGAFVIKINDYTKQMYRYICESFRENRFHHTKWPFDQFYISNFVYENREKFIIFKPEIFNTPVGIVLRHNWLKNKKMYDDLHDIINSSIYSIENSVDNSPFPSTTDGYDYIHSWPDRGMPPNMPAEAML